ncbi:hypothetical protein LBAT_1585 [Lactobacillus acetotolerans]|uniref:Uncharacterized protein n=1 Tax=Lactobacillus acetotolerans TaxID=1600 RepID=A0A0D6A5I0_9LACO|nr:hypothetical protein [Lactobacillus acetotolerans]BAQ57974.1 hypothetical protein LBAT_1585 [Lactobacillus acetotolerans]
MRAVSKIKPGGFSGQTARFSYGSRINLAPYIRMGQYYGRDQRKNRRVSKPTG